jgi:hypothetical protein
VLQSCQLRSSIVLSRLHSAGIPPRLVTGWGGAPRSPTRPIHWPNNLTHSLAALSYECTAVRQIYYSSHLPVGRNWHTSPQLRIWGKGLRRPWRHCEVAVPPGH